jgi:DNA-directed RNA polymerase specialized sigma24 family protein
MISKEELAVIEEVAEALSSSNWVPGYEKEDIRQEAIIIGLQGIAKYNEKTTLKQYLYSHIRHRLCSLRRKHFIRPGCVNGKNNCGVCIKCLNNESKQRIKSATPIQEIDEDLLEYSCEDIVELQEISEEIDKIMPADLREDYLKYLSGVSISSQKRKKILEIVGMFIDE